MLLDKEQAELMPALAGLGGYLAGLGCGGDRECGCGKGMKGMGELGELIIPTPPPSGAVNAADPIKRSTPEWQSYWCGKWIGIFNPGCTVPSIDEVLKDNSNAGGHLSEASKQAATDAATQAVQGDEACNYSAMTGFEKMFPGADCGGSGVNWLLIGSGVVAGWLLIKFVGNRI